MALLSARGTRVSFFAFEGAVAAQAAAIRDSDCPEVFFAAVAALVSPMELHMKIMGNKPPGRIGCSFYNVLQSYMVINTNEG